MSDDLPVHWWRDRAACGGPENIKLVDAAMSRPGGLASKHLREQLCAHCPVAAECFTEAMTEGRHGVWGGTTPKQRTSHGAPSVRMPGRPDYRYK